jgi:hypothetical protein
MSITLFLIAVVLIWTWVWALWPTTELSNDSVKQQTSDKDDMKPKALSGFFKRGSSWSFSIIRKDSTGTAIDLTDVTLFRAIFRIESVDGTVLLTIDSTNGLSIPTPINGTIQIDLTPVQTVLFPVATKVYFDIELTYGLTGEVWQSPTYYLVAEQEVTRDA